MPIVPLDPNAHGRFVFGTWCISAGEPRERLHYLLRTGVARAVVRVFARMGHDGKPLFGGWAAAVVADPQVVIWAYTQPRVRKDGNMVAFLTAAGCDTTKPMRAAFRSPACDGLIRGGWPIAYLSRDELEALYLRPRSADPQPKLERER
jgi:hypothetical protein